MQKWRWSFGGVHKYSTYSRDVVVYRWRCGGVELDAWRFGCVIMCTVYGSGNVEVDVKIWWWS